MGVGGDRAVAVLVIVIEEGDIHRTSYLDLFVCFPFALMLLEELEMNEKRK